jgi:D-hexose-6-phosphate mutarotase
MRIESRGAGSTIVWNPGPSKTATLADMSPDGFDGFVCVEDRQRRRPTDHAACPAAATDAVRYACRA